ncbi:hypothetical protein GOP47_0014739, partial [Adiantum capillus-veneris]
CYINIPKPHQPSKEVDQKIDRWTMLNSGVMAFNKKSPSLLKFIEEFCICFDGSVWGHNGPPLLTRVLMREPNLEVKVMDRSAFSPVHWDHIGSYFQAPRNDTEKQWVEAEMKQLIHHSFCLHLWNRVSKNMFVEPGSIIDRVFQHVCILCDSNHTYAR